jgi:hypothetical protein
MRINAGLALRMMSSAGAVWCRCGAGAGAGAVQVQVHRYSSLEGRKRGGRRVGRRWMINVRWQSMLRWSWDGDENDDAVPSRVTTNAGRCGAGVVQFAVCGAVHQCSPLEATSQRSGIEEVRR